MEISREWMERFYPDFAAKVDEEVNKANSRSKEALPKGGIFTPREEEDISIENEKYRVCRRLHCGRTSKSPLNDIQWTNQGFLCKPCRELYATLVHPSMFAYDKKHCRCPECAKLSSDTRKERGLS